MRDRLVMSSPVEIFTERVTVTAQNRIAVIDYTLVSVKFYHPAKFMCPLFKTDEMYCKAFIQTDTETEILFYKTQTQSKTHLLNN